MPGVLSVFLYCLPMSAAVWPQFW